MLKKSCIGLMAATLVAALSVPVPMADAQTIKMKMSSFTGPAHFMTPILSGYADALSAASSGEVAVQYFGAEALGKAKEHWDVAVEGLADIALFCAIYTPSRFPLSMMLELPFFSNNAQVSSQVVSAFQDKGLIGGEFTETKLLSVIATAPAQIFATKKIESLQDFKGLRLTGIGPIWSRTWALLDAQSVSMGWPDIYLSLERGTIDAATTSWAASVGWKWQEVAKHPIDIGIMGGFFCGVVMNNASWGKLSAKTQESWRVLNVEYSMRFSKAYDDGDQGARKKWIDAGRTIVTFPINEKRKLAETLLPIWQDWVDGNEAKGKPAKKMYALYVETMKKLGQPVVMQIPGLY